MTGVLRHRRRDRERARCSLRTAAEIGVAQPWVRTPAAAELEEEGTEALLEPLDGAQPCRHQDWTPALRNCEGSDCCCFRPPSGGSLLWQAQQTSPPPQVESPGLGALSEEGVQVCRTPQCSPGQAGWWRPSWRKAESLQWGPAQSTILSAQRPSLHCSCHSMSHRRSPLSFFLVVPHWAYACEIIVEGVTWAHPTLWPPQTG